MYTSAVCVYISLFEGAHGPAYAETTTEQPCSLRKVLVWAKKGRGGAFW